MALRTFTADDGRTWNVWPGRPTQSLNPRRGPAAPDAVGRDGFTVSEA